MKKQKLKLFLNKKVIANPQLNNLKGGVRWSEYYWQCPYNSEVCTDFACPTGNCPVTSNDTDGHSNQCDTTNPTVVVIF
ncbi:hypothetical protein [Kordia sp.]|uniref:hypothetical protein n=1 Tax=Kordia sp. TaxID=1965332 RepID=UPI003D29F804